MKLGEVFKKERERTGLTVEHIARELAMSIEEYEELESCRSLAEAWGPLFARIAIETETPTSRLVAETGKAHDHHPGGAGKLIKEQRCRRQTTVQVMAETLELDLHQYLEIEEGRSPIETVGPRLLRFAELIDQPVFNLLYPCGLPLEEIDDYP